jgi:hypothetical protein
MEEIIRDMESKAHLLEEYRHKDLFIPIIDVSLEDSKRKTLLHFTPLVSNEIYKRKTEWVYLIIMNNRIVKIGGTCNGVKEIHLMNKKGSAIHTALIFYINCGCKVKFYGYELPIKKIEIEICGETHEIIPKTYHALTSLFMEDYKKQFLQTPFFTPLNI